MEYAPGRSYFDWPRHNEADRHYHPAGGDWWQSTFVRRAVRKPGS